MDARKIEIEVSDPEKTYEAVSRDPRMFGVRMRSVLVGRRGGDETQSDRWALEAEFGVRIASATDVFKSNS